jgi:hypothetical protein
LFASIGTALTQGSCSAAVVVSESGGGTPSGVATGALIQGRVKVGSNSASADFQFVVP